MRPAPMPSRCCWRQSIRPIKGADPVMSSENGTDWDKGFLRLVDLSIISTCFCPFYTTELRQRLPYEVWNITPNLLSQTNNLLQSNRTWGEGESENCSHYRHIVHSEFFGRAAVRRATEWCFVCAFGKSQTRPKIIPVSSGAQNNLHSAHVLYKSRAVRHEITQCLI